MELFGTELNRKLFEENREFFMTAGLIAASVLSVLLVALSTYARRRCSHPAVRMVVLGASLVFLPLTASTISSLLQKRQCDLQVREELLKLDKQSSIAAPGLKNSEARKMWNLLLWFALMLIIKGNADTAAAATGATSALPQSGDVSIDGQRISPSVGHLFQYGVLASLIWQCLPVAEWMEKKNIWIFIAFCAVGLAKTVLKLAASYFGSKSFALGKNARLIAGYMSSQLTSDEAGRPRFIVMGERKKHVEERPHGYRLKRAALTDRFSSLITLDRVWREAEDGEGILAERRELRDLCLSYSLFKILRRRLSGYSLADADEAARSSGESLEFVLRGMDSVGAGGAANSDRVFRVLVDELWFASDFYFSPIPLCTLSGWCAALNFLFSVLTIAGAIEVGVFYKKKDVVQIKEYEGVVTYFLLAATVLVELWEVIAGMCSNWAKVAVLGHYLRHESAWRRSGFIHATLAAFLRLRPARRWRDKLGQNSVLEPRRFLRRSGLLAEKLYGRTGLMRSVPVSEAVKDAVLRSLLSSYGRVSGKGGGAVATARGRIIDWAMYGSQKSWAGEKDNADDRPSSITDLILMWHVGTRLFEMKSTSGSADMAAATHLSNYLAYLVAAAPDLLPDSTAWTELRYKEVTEDVRAALGGGDGGESTAAQRYERMVAALSARSRDAVLRRGAEIGRHLVKEYAKDEASAGRILADVWSEMLLYVAPSDNVKAHVQAMARGGEFITLVWALLFHAGVTTRPAETPGGAIV